MISIKFTSWFHETRSRTFVKKRFCALADRAHFRKYPNRKKLKYAVFYKHFHLLESQHGGVPKGAQSIMFGSFFETKTQESPSACRKNLICAKYTYFLCFVITFWSACIGMTPWEKQAGLNLRPNDRNIEY